MATMIFLDDCIGVLRELGFFFFGGGTGSFLSMGRVYSLVYSFSMRKGRAESPTAAFSPGHRPGLGHSTMIVRPERAKARPNRWGFFKYNGVGRAFALTGRKVNELA